MQSELEKSTYVFIDGDNVDYTKIEKLMPKLRNLDAKILLYRAGHVITKVLLFCKKHGIKYRPVEQARDAVDVEIVMDIFENINRFKTVLIFSNDKIFFNIAKRLKQRGIGYYIMFEKKSLKRQLDELGIKNKLMI